MAAEKTPTFSQKGTPHRKNTNRRPAKSCQPSCRVPLETATEELTTHTHIKHTTEKVKLEGGIPLMYYIASICLLSISGVHIDSFLSKKSVPPIMHPERHGLYPSLPRWLGRTEMSMARNTGYGNPLGPQSTNTKSLQQSDTAYKTSQEGS